MRNLKRIRRGVRRRVARWIGASKPPRVDESTRTREPFYSQQPSCQVPTLWFLFSRYLGERESGTYVEVGAHDGVTVSNTWGLAKRFWSGLMVEPVPHLAAKCRENHRAHGRVRVVERAIGGPGRDSVVLKVADTLTTASQATFDEYGGVAWARNSLTDEEITVTCSTLDVLLENHEIQPGFDLLVVDVEGFEDEVFSGFALSQWQPKMMIVELCDTHPDLNVTSAGDALLGQRIVETGYRIVYKDHINSVFVRSDIWGTAHDSAFPRRRLSQPELKPLGDVP